MATRDEIIKIVFGLAALYPTTKVTEATVDGYIGSLQDIEAEYLSIAAKDCVERNKWFPSVSELRESAVNLMLGSAHAMPALEAWGELKRAVAIYGRERQPEFSDPILAATVSALGWVDFCNSDISDEMSWRARFVELYSDYRRREIDQARMSPEVRQISARQAEVRRTIGKLTASFSMPSRLSAGGGR